MLILVLLPLLVCGQEWVMLQNSTYKIEMMRDGNASKGFADKNTVLGCGMPHLFIYNDTKHDSYRIMSKNVQILSVEGKYLPIQYNISCKSKNCEVNLENGCQGNGKNEMNWIIVNTDQQKLQYLVNCAPDLFYKPFEWGLFILIGFCTICITLSSLYSRAWSYDGFGISVNEPFIIVFNLLFIIGSVLAYFIPTIISISLKVVGSVIGIMGVTICMSEILWLIKSPSLKNKVLWKIRYLDIVSFLVGALMILLYWITDGVWLLNDVLAVSIIIAGIKILKLRSLKIGILMLLSFLLFEVVAGLIIHYVVGVSYNNLVIQLFQSPLVIVFPSITHQFYRKCAWLPVTNLIFPGLFISYLRRFDKARGTLIYLLVGYVSFYVGSVAWIFVDMLTVHSLPVAILSDPIIIFCVCLIANRRNELKTMMSGLFFDPEMPDVSEQLLPQKYERQSAYHELTKDLKIERQSSQGIGQI